MEDRTDYLDPPPLTARVLRLAWLLALGAAVAGVGELVIRPWFRRHLIEASPAESAAHFRQLLFALSGLLFAVSAWGFWLASRVARHGQWPLPGTFVFHRTAIQRGLKVKLRVIGIVFSAVFAAAVGVYAAVLAQQLFGR